MAEDLKRFQYTARNSEGVLVSGNIAADSETNAARRLQSMTLAPLSIRPASSSSGKKGTSSFSLDPRKRKKKVKPKDLAMFSRQFATMTNAGLPLVRSLNALAAQTDHATMKEVLTTVRTDVEGGMSLSASFSKHPTVFPPLLVGMVAAGEVAGSLDTALETIATNYDKEARLRGKIKGALVYPIIVMAMAFLMVTFMMIFVIPTFKNVFAQLGGTLPAPTQVLINISGSWYIWLPTIVVLGFAFSIWWGANKNNPKVRDFVDPLKLKIPIFGKFSKKIVLARFARTFASLLSSGVPIIQTLDIVSATAGNVIISRAINDVRESVRSGRPIWSTMEQHPIFPPLVIQMVSTGEETGALGLLLTKLAEFYEQEVEVASEALSATLEPVLLIFLGVVVGGMVIALYLPMFTVYQYIKTS